MGLIEILGLAGSVSLSPASIRNVMQDLEELGLLSHPHTSAGRMPTETGLRLFVDAIMQVAEPRAEDRVGVDHIGDGAAATQWRSRGVPRCTCWPPWLSMKARTSSNVFTHREPRFDSGSEPAH